MWFVYLNGEVLPESEACIPVNDRSVLFGDAAYETMRSYSGRFFRFPEHLERLRHTAKGMALDLPYDDESVTRGAQDLIRKNGLSDARLRLTLTGGLHEGAIRLARPHRPNLIMVAFPLSGPSREELQDGVDVVVSRWRVHFDSPLPRIKTVNRLMHLMAKEEALAGGAYESVFLDEQGRVLEGTATNIFFVVRGALVTPDLSLPILPGVTRDAVLEAARAVGIPAREEAIRLEATGAASEAFLTGSTIELLPIRAWNGNFVGAGKPGPVWHSLLARYRSIVANETGASLLPLPGDA